ncbi:hypothetical protein IQ270_21875 [Microcoleus sp. LEGE 07076]|uniref:hypothetical protein n=1 Tax=Microcoleus sp. LEGE 07076 TaxID=915322 RepID=UPI0018815492|nr:hypothetical protein [Microcoleus sp. LEGE 07076]MBE9187226.1 hypothetical protein [Microcoleus sp. LEGE 07076]
MITPVAGDRAARLGYGLSIDMIGKFNKLDRRTAFCFFLCARENTRFRLFVDFCRAIDRTVFFCLKNRDRGSTIAIFQFW